jgi:hypothetical protein
LADQPRVTNAEPPISSDAARKRLPHLALAITDGDLDLSPGE